MRTGGTLQHVSLAPNAEVESIQAQTRSGRSATVPDFDVTLRRHGNVVQRPDFGDQIVGPPAPVVQRRLQPLPMFGVGWVGGEVRRLARVVPKVVQFDCGLI
jgi:hypothetical protein